MKAEIKRFILRALYRMDSMPMPDAALVRAVQEAVYPQPTVGDVNVARRELEVEGYIHGSTDSFDKSVSWTLTPKGEHKAKQLG